MTNEEQIKQAARSYAELEIEIEAGYVLTARNAFIAGANFGRELGMKEAVSEVEKILLDLDWDDMSWGVDDLIKLIREELQ